jgi:hypothetical protein
LAIVVCRPSWRETLSRRRPDFHKKEKEVKRKNIRKGKPVETAAAVEIDQGGLRRFFLDDFHNGLKKASAKTLQLFFTVPTGSATADNQPSAYGRGKHKTWNRHLHKIPDTTFPCVPRESFFTRCHISDSSFVLLSDGEITG